MEAAGGPLGDTSAGANVHDTKRRAGTLEAIVEERPQPTAEVSPHLCLDKGEDHPPGHEPVATEHDSPPIRRIGEEKLDRHGQQTPPARRWVVGRTLAWLSTGRARLVRSEQKAVNV